MHVDALFCLECKYTDFFRIRKNFNIHELKSEEGAGGGGGGFGHFVEADAAEVGDFLRNEGDV